MKKFFASIALALALTLSVVGCGPNIPQMENPVAGMPVPQTGIDGSSAAIGALAGAAGGYMMGKSSSNSQRPIIVQQGSSYGGYRGYSRPYGSRGTTTTTTVRRNAFGGTTTRSITRRR